MRGPPTDFGEGGRLTTRDRVVINGIRTLRVVVARYKASV